MSELVTDSGAERIRQRCTESETDWPMLGGIVDNDVPDLLHTRSALIEALEKIKATTPPTEFAYEIARQLLSIIHATEGNENG